MDEGVASPKVPGLPTPTLDHRHRARQGLNSSQHLFSEKFDASRSYTGNDENDHSVAEHQFGQIVVPEDGINNDDLQEFMATDHMQTQQQIDQIDSEGWAQAEEDLMIMNACSMQTSSDIGFWTWLT